jgi:hypothetical protein
VEALALAEARFFAAPFGFSGSSFLRGSFGRRRVGARAALTAGAGPHRAQALQLLRREGGAQFREHAGLQQDALGLQLSQRGGVLANGFLVRLPGKHQLVHFAVVGFHPLLQIARAFAAGFHVLAELLALFGRQDFVQRRAGARRLGGRAFRARAVAGRVGAAFRALGGGLRAGQPRDVADGGNERPQGSCPQGYGFHVCFG